MGSCLRIFSVLMFCAVIIKIEAEPPNGAALATASPYASRAGMEVLAQGGNAFDAAVAISATLAVTEPYHSGIGGGGFWLVYDAKTKRAHFIDGRERAPQNAKQNMYIDNEGKKIKNASLIGPKSAAIPGEPAALCYLQKHFGKLSLKTDLKRAMELSKNGYPVDERYIELLKAIGTKKMSRYKKTASIFLADGKIPKPGWILKQPELFHTLKQIALRGHKGFYEGEIANSLVDAVVANGGIWSLKDLKDYTVIDRKPLRGTFRNINIITAPPPSAGGVALLTMLNILSNYKVESLPFVDEAHLMIEAMRLAYRDRILYLGDSDYSHIPVKKLTSIAHAKQLAKFIKPHQATSSASLSGRVNLFSDENGHTTHFSVIDKKGNIVSATLSINYLFGSKFVAGNTGVLLNDEMDDFASSLKTRNVFGLQGERNNLIAPGKRPLSSMMPTILLTKDRVGILGTPGGSRIPTMMLLGVLSFAEGKHPMQWVSRPRFHHQYLPDVVIFERDAFSLAQRKALRSMGHVLKPLRRDYGNKTYYYGEMQAVEWDKKNHELYAASDPRRAGLALVIND